MKRPMLGRELMEEDL